MPQGQALFCSCFSAFVFYFCCIRHACTCIFLSTGSLLFVCPCAGLSGADSVNLLLCSETGSTVLTAVFVTGSTWHLTAFPQACCWWRKCHGIRWARSTRRTYCDISSHDRTVFKSGRVQIRCSLSESPISEVGSKVAFTIGTNKSERDAQIS